MVSLDERLEMTAKFLPHYYYQVALSFQELNFSWLFALLGISLAMVLIAWWLFLRRDIRLAGEGSWQLPKIFQKDKLTKTSA
jgi:ABC-2 type transport system permease protein